MIRRFTYIRAPYPEFKVTSVLPSPLLGDSITPAAQVNVKRSMLGRIITYVKASNRQTLILPFLLTRPKALEISELFRVYYRATVQIETEYDGVIYVGNLVGPIETSPKSKWVNNIEMVQATLTFSVEKVN